LVEKDTTNCHPAYHIYPKEREGPRESPNDDHRKINSKVQMEAQKT
jgi:hypothetical protein